MPENVQKVVQLTGRFKRPNQPGHQIGFAVHAVLPMKDSRGKLVPYLFGVRTDAEAQGWMGVIRLDGFVQVEKKATEEPVMDMANVYFSGFGSPNFAPAEEITDPADLAFLPEGSRLVSEFAVPAEALLA